MPLQLRLYQEKACQQVMEAWRAGHRSVLMCAPTGSGKRVVALWFMELAAKNNRKVLFCGNRRLLINQAAEDAERYEIPYGVIMADLMQGDYGSGNQIASLQTLESRHIYDKWTKEATGHGLPDADLLIHDECFTGETLISTPCGLRRIDQLRSGDVVYCASGVGIVDSVFMKPTHEIYSLEFSDGSRASCTGDHPFFTDDGWVAACNMEGKTAFSLEAVRLLWESVLSMGQAGCERENHQQHAVREVDEAVVLLSVLCQEIKKPNEQPPISPQDEGQAEGDTAQAYQAWRQRAIAALSSVSALACTWGGVGSGVFRKNRTAVSGTASVQDRHIESDPEDRDRAGWPVALPTREAGARLAKGGVPGLARVVRVSHHQRACATPVFNLRVSGHPSYFANGKLVHNCHSDIERFWALAEFYPHAKILGLSATPVGAQGRALVPDTYRILLEPILNSELIAQGHLLPTRVFAPSEPEIEGVKVDNGKEFNQAALGRSVQACTVFADVFREWSPYQDRATVAFVPGVAFGRDLVNQFNHRLGQSFPGGIAAQLIEAKTKPHERQEILDRVKAQKRGIIVSVDVLREGFDLPVLSCGLDLQPNSQLRSYWQKIGRIKRPCDSQSHAIWLDLAGNFWRFLHPDQDPIWPQGEETTQEVIERRKETGEEPQPIVCPKCSFARTKGAVCPNCGHESSKPVKRIRMGDGTLREVSAIEAKKRELTADERLRNKWQSQLYVALHCDHSFRQAAHLFYRATGQYPRQGWAGVWEPHAADWSRKVRGEFDKGSLYKAFRRAS